MGKFVSPIDSYGNIRTDDPVKERILLSCIYNSKNWSQLFLSESFNKPMTEYNNRIFGIYDDESIPRAAICGYRGIGKTTTVKGFVAKRIAFRQSRFIAFVSYNQDYAMEQTEDIKAHLFRNKEIRKIFGFTKPQKIEDTNLSFGKKGWFVADPISQEPIAYVLPVGAGQNIRGKNVMVENGLTVRPDLIIFEDFEDAKEVWNADLRRTLFNWIHDDALQAVDEVRPNPRTGRWPRPNVATKAWVAPWRVIFQDTLKHEDCAMAKLLTNRDWVSVRMPQCEYRGGTEKVDFEEFYSLVPDRVTDEQIRHEARQADRNNNLDGFFREKMCLPMSPTRATFNAGMFRYYEDGIAGLNNEPGTVRFLVVDPARTTGKEAAFSAILSVAIVPMENRIYLRKVLNARLDPHEIAREVMVMAKETNSRIIAVETTGLDLWVKQEFQQAAIQYGMHGIQFEWFTGHEATVTGGEYGTGPEAKKRARGGQIAPYYRMGFVYHDVSLQDGPAEHALLQYPQCEYWDVMDTMGYIPAVMQRLGVWLEGIVQDERMGVQDEYQKEFDETTRLLEAGAGMHY